MLFQTDRSSPERLRYWTDAEIDDALKAAETYAQGWSMESLAERYVDVYERAIALYDAAH